MCIYIYARFYYFLWGAAIRGEKKTLNRVFDAHKVRAIEGMCARKKKRAHTHTYVYINNKLREEKNEQHQRREQERSFFLPIVDALERREIRSAFSKMRHTKISGGVHIAQDNATAARTHVFCQYI